MSVEDSHGRVARQPNDGWQVCCRLWGVVWVGCGVVVVGVGWWWIWCVVVVGVMFLKRSGAG